MKTFLLGLLVGAGTTWVLMTTVWERRITEKVTVTNEVTWTVIETQLVEQAVQIVQTNIVWRTNVAEQAKTQTTEIMPQDASIGIIYSTPPARQKKEKINVIPASSLPISPPIVAPVPKQAVPKKKKPASRVIIKKDSKPTTIKFSR